MLTRGQRGRGGGPSGWPVLRKTPGHQGWRCRVPCRSGSLDRHGELLEKKFIVHGAEGGKRHGPLDESLQVVVAGAEATQEVQHQGTVRHRLAEVAEGVCQALHLAAVLPHREVALGELVELGVEVKGPSVPVPKELFLEGEPRLAGHVRLVADDVLELDGDCVVEPGEHDGVHQGPGRRRRGDVVVKDVVGEGIASQGEEELPPLARVVGGRRVQHNGHEGPDVVETGSLRMKGGDVVGVESRGDGSLGVGGG
jgi:hypothetical protein